MQRIEISRSNNYRFDSRNFFKHLQRFFRTCCYTTWYSVCHHRVVIPSRLHHISEKYNFFFGTLQILHELVDRIGFVNSCCSNIDRCCSSTTKSIFRKVWCYTINYFLSFGSVMISRFFDFKWCLLPKRGKSHLSHSIFDNLSSYLLWIPTKMMECIDQHCFQTFFIFFRKRFTCNEDKFCSIPTSVLCPTRGEQMETFCLFITELQLRNDLFLKLRSSSSRDDCKIIRE